MMQDWVATAQAPDPRMTSATIGHSAARENLRRLTAIRYIALGGQVLALAFFARLAPPELPLPTIVALTGVFAALNVLTHWRSFRPRPITELEFFGHLLFDIGGLTTLLYFSGGATNPFVSYYLVPVSIAAATLPARYVWAVAGLALASYSLLIFFYRPLLLLAPHHVAPHLGEAAINGHVLGMWLNFVISAGLITYFVVKMAAALRRQEQELTARREEQLQDEQLLGIATLAAGAAHELGTPLNTMKLLIDNLAAEPLPAAIAEDIGTLERQIERCRETLRTLVQAGGIINREQPPQPVTDYVRDLIKRWRVIRPDVDATVTIDGASPAITALFHPALAQSLHNLLNNAADASPQRIEIDIRWDRELMRFVIRDHGPGVDGSLVEKLGQPITSGKPDGLGLGLFLSHSTLNRHGGRVTLANADGGGTLTSVWLPLKVVP